MAWLLAKKRRIREIIAGSGSGPASPALLIDATHYLKIDATHYLLIN